MKLDGLEFTVWKSGDTWIAYAMSLDHRGDPMEVARGEGSTPVTAMIFAEIDARQRKAPKR